MHFWDRLVFRLQAEFVSVPVVSWQLFRKFCMDSKGMADVQETKGNNVQYLKVSAYIVIVQQLSHVQLFETPWTVTCQVLSEGFSRQEYWSGLLFSFCLHKLAKSLWQKSSHIPEPKVMPQGMIVFVVYKDGLQSQKCIRKLDLCYCNRFKGKNRINNVVYHDYVRTILTPQVRNKKLSPLHYLQNKIG